MSKNDEKNESWKEKIISKTTGIVAHVGDNIET